MLKAPIVGPIMVKAAIARYARTLSTMFAAGVPLVEALTSVAGATGNIVYEEATLKIRDEVSTGQRLQRSMEATGLFPNMVIQMIAVGEESGSLDSMACEGRRLLRSGRRCRSRRHEQLARAADHGDPRRAGRRPGHRDVPADLQARAPWSEARTVPLAAWRGNAAQCAAFFCNGPPRRATSVRDMYEAVRSPARPLRTSPPAVDRDDLRARAVHRQLPQRRDPSPADHAGA